MKLTKIEKEIFEAAANSSMGLIEISRYSIAAQHIWKLVDKGLLIYKSFPTIQLPMFVDEFMYYGLTEKGFKEAKKFNKATKSKNNKTKKAKKSKEK